MKKLFSIEQIIFLQKNVTERPFHELTRIFNDKFGTVFSVNQVKYACLDRGFKSGLLNYKPIGSERVDKESGRILVKICDAPPTWRNKHVLIWERLNGSVPSGHKVIFADGNNRNFAPDNLILVSNAELMVMNRKGLIYDDADLTKIGQSVAKVVVKIHEKTTRNKAV